MTLETDRQDIKDQAVALGKRLARLEDSIHNWTERVDDIKKMISLLGDAWQTTKAEQRRLEELLHNISLPQRATGS